MYTTILVPLDGSGRAEAILPHVEGLAQCLGTKLVLLRVVDPVASMTGMEGMPIDVTRELIQQEADEAERYLEAKRGELAARHIDVKISVRYGPIVQAIIDAAGAEQADLIAIASHGRTGLARMFYGSVAAGVLNRAEHPLLIIRSRDEG
ncbi:MAG: universal stress protein [Anaerolineae bacterium]|nr:universal stress protein [Anaerolineae bacterium]